jgi:hypothetical protein
VEESLKVYGEKHCIIAHCIPGVSISSPRLALSPCTQSSKRVPRTPWKFVVKAYTIFSISTALYLSWGRTAMSLYDLFNQSRRVRDLSLDVSLQRRAASSIRAHSLTASQDPFRVCIDVPGPVEEVARCCSIKMSKSPSNLWLLLNQMQCMFQTHLPLVFEVHLFYSGCARI